MTDNSPKDGTATCKPFLQVRTEGKRRRKGDLAPAATIKSHLIVRTDGTPQVRRPVRQRYRALEDARPRAVDVAFEQATKDLKKLKEPAPARKGRRNGDA